MSRPPRSGQGWHIRMLDIKTIKKQFPIFQNQPGLVYLDSSATSLKPKLMINKLREYYEEYSANVFRGIYPISEKATEEFEETRRLTAKFINANRSEEIVFTRNTTESLNLLAYTLTKKNDEIVTTIMEHHSNFVPWQILAGKVGAVFKVIDINEEGYLDLESDSIKKIITKKTKIFTLTYVSNVLGTINPIKQIIEEAKKINPKIVVIVDAAQAVPHLKIDVRDLGADFVVFSSHKMLGPTGVGVLWGKEELLREMDPFIYGGEMIDEVSVNRSTFKQPPHKFEAGTPSIGEVIAFKSCFPNSAITDTAMLNQYKTWYLEMRSYFDAHPEKLFVVMSTPPLHRLATNTAEASNARAFANWLKSPTYLSGHPNIVCFDLFDYFAGADNFLKYEYEGDHASDDSHPNAAANETVGPIFSQFLRTLPLCR